LFKHHFFLFRLVEKGRFFSRQEDGAATPSFHAYLTAAAAAVAAAQIAPLFTRCKKPHLLFLLLFLPRLPPPPSPPPFFPLLFGRERGKARNLLGGAKMERSNRKCVSKSRPSDAVGALRGQLRLLSDSGFSAERPQTGSREGKPRVQRRHRPHQPRHLE